VIETFYESTKTHDLSETKTEDKIEVQEENESDTEEEDKVFEQFKTEPKEKWDCESILSTYSNIYNHPKLIEESRSTKKYVLHKHTGIPIGVFATANKKEESQEMDCEMSEIVVLNNVRNKDETPEERKQRKREVKEQRKKRRVVKKANKMAFKNEMKNQEKVTNNTIAQKGIIKL